MIYLAVGELVLIAGLVWFLGRRESQHAATIVDLIASQEAERAELLTRIQRPEIIYPRAKMPEARKRTADEIAADRALGQIGRTVPSQDA